MEQILTGIAESGQGAGKAALVKYVSHQLMSWFSASTRSVVALLLK